MIGENGKLYLSQMRFPKDPDSLAMNTKAKANYKVRNWKEYDAALKQRGSITFACE
jgi:hypothetical protein